MLQKPRMKWLEGVCSKLKDFHFKKRDKENSKVDEETHGGALEFIDECSLMILFLLFCTFLNES